jgi:hypothetical protein
MYSTTGSRGGRGRQERPKTISIFSDVGNLIMNSTSISIGLNATANVTANSSLLQLANSTSIANLTPASLNIGNSTVNGTANSIQVVLSNSTVQSSLGIGTLVVGNSSVNVTSNSSVINVGANSSISNTLIASGGSLLSANIQTNPQTGTTYTLVAGDSGKIVTCNNASSITVTVPAALPIGFRCMVMQVNTGVVTLSNTGQTGASIFSRTSAFAITSKWGTASVVEVAANVYVIDGSI